MARSKPRAGYAQLIEYGVIALAVVLAWQIVVALFAERAPVEVAVRLAPGSPVALIRAAESELKAGRNNNAAVLARSALRIAPFNARALSMVGRMQDAAGDADAADQTLTLAGNWSLRDDPAHAWLMNRRLKQGDYVSAFAHAETLARRDSPTQPQLFEMFTVASMADPRGLSALIKALSIDPPWRNRYIQSVSVRPGTDQLLADLAVNLQRTAGPLTDAELSGVYRRWLDPRQPAVIGALQKALGRPRLESGVWNGDFAPGVGIAPLNWSINLSAGFSAQITDTGESDRGPALLIETNGVSSGVIVSQLLLLPPGPATLRIMQRVEDSGRTAGLQWRIICFETGETLMGWSTGKSLETAWREQVQVFTTPSRQCAAQRLQLQAVGGDRRDPVRVWFDAVRIEPGQTTASH